MNSDYTAYMKFTGKARFEKSVNSLVGIIEGISIDSVINSSEVAFLNLWLSEHRELAGKHPYTELIPVVQNALADGVFSKDEKEDVLWLCERLRSADFFNEVTADLQRLHAILGGIISDGDVSKEELIGLREWLNSHEHLRTRWPFDEVDSLVISVLANGVVDESEQKLLRSFFAEFVSLLDDKTITSPLIEVKGLVGGLCAICPEITFSGGTFAFTGASARYSRKLLGEVVTSLGGVVADGVSKKINYLIIGADGNPCWAYACYGRKVEKAIELRKQGSPILLVHEHDFHDSVEDAKIT
jgi:BRCA1 C Terminus (BRCT) domain